MKKGYYTIVEKYKGKEYLINTRTRAVAQIFSEEKDELLSLFIIHITKIILHSNLLNNTYEDINKYLSEFSVQYRNDFLFYFKPIFNTCSFSTSNLNEKIINKLVYMQSSKVFILVQYLILIAIFIVIDREGKIQLYFNRY